MSKIKLFSGKKRCVDGENYIFRKGIAIVPGFLLAGKEVKISTTQFRDLQKEDGYDPETD